MGKYSFSVDTSCFNNGHSIVVKAITKNSTILELGCSSGYLTRYFKEKLDSSVSIVEINEEDYQLARQYAVDGICTDLEKDDWNLYYSGKKFDFVLLTDVLEHLRNPQDVLQRAAKFLNEDGTIIVTIPNIAHNDILINLMNNHWNYMSLGILDDTHVHFWAYNNLDSLFQKAGLAITEKDYTISPAFQSEQKYSGDISNQLPVIDFLCRSKFGDVYQFVFFAKNARFAKEKHMECKDHYYERHESFGELPQCCIDYEARLIHQEEERVLELEAAYQEQNRLLARLEESQTALDAFRQAYDAISNAFFWKITKPFRITADELKNVFKECRPVVLLWKGLKCLKNNGFQYTFKRVGDKLKNRNNPVSDDKQ